MIFRQLVHDDLGCASYLVGDEDAGVAAVVDPAYEVERYLDLARYLGVRIEHVFETHDHADHLSGHGRLAAATGATIHVHRLSEPEYDHEPFDDGDEFALGALTVRALHTPGHRPEHTAFALIDTDRDDAPWAVLTGDTLFVGDTARPDLAVEPEEGARGIFRSLRDKLLVLAPETEVWPGHLGGSMCGGPGMDLKVSSTIGYERRANPTLAIEDEQEFVDGALTALGPQPPNFEAIVALNRGPLVTEDVRPQPLAPRQLELRRDAGALVVDVRTDLQFDEAHVPGAVCAPIHRAGFGSKLAWLADPEREVVLVGRDGDDAQDAARLALSVGVRRIGGYLDGGMTAWRQERRPVGRIARVTLDELEEQLTEDPGLQLLDVRDPPEHAAGHVPGSTLVPWHDLTTWPDGLDRDRPVAVICASGQRAATATGLIAGLGAADVRHVVDGGVPAWGRRGHELARDAGG